MATITSVNRGTVAGDGTGEILYDAFGKVNANDTALNNQLIASISFNTGNGVLTLTKEDASTFTVDLDGRYLQSETSHADVLVDGDFTSQGIMLRGATSGSYSILTDNSTNWNTAFSWGDHALAGYQVGTPTLQEVLTAGNSATSNITTTGTITGNTITSNGDLTIQDASSAELILNDTGGDGADTISTRLLFQSGGVERGTIGWNTSVGNFGINNLTTGDNYYNIATGAVHRFRINSVEEFTLDASTANFQANDITTTGDITGSTIDLTGGTTGNVILGQTTVANVWLSLADSTTTNTTNGKVAMRRSGNNLQLWSNSSKQLQFDTTGEWDFQGNNITTTGDISLLNPNSGTTTVAQNHPGYLATATGMNATSKYTPGYLFGSTDPNFTTTNPKMLAGMVGVATETYAANTDAGMGLEFFWTANNAGATPTPVTALAGDNLNGWNFQGYNITTSGRITTNNANFYQSLATDTELNDKQWNSIGGRTIGVDNGTAASFWSQTSSSGTWEKHWITTSRNGGVSLYYNGSQKIAATSTGMSVTGTTTTGKTVVSDDPARAATSRDIDSIFQVFVATNLGGTAGNSLCYAQMGGDVANAAREHWWILRNATGSDWNTASFHQGIAIDTSFDAPTTSRCFWERDIQTGAHYWGDAGTKELELDGSGNLTANNDITAFGTPSDVRLKENIEPISNAVERLEKIQGVTYNYKRRPDTRLMGVLAQELLEDDVLKLAVYENREFPGAEDKYYAARYQHLTAILIEAVKELSARVKELEDAD